MSYTEQTAHQQYNEVSFLDGMNNNTQVSYMTIFIFTEDLYKPL